MHNMMFHVLANSIVSDLFNHFSGILTSIGNGVINICGFILIGYATYRYASLWLHANKGGPPPGSAWVMPTIALCFGGVFTSGLASATSGFLGSLSDGLMSDLMKGTSFSSSGSSGDSPGNSSATGIDLSAFFSTFETEVGDIANGVVKCAAVLMIFVGCVQLTKILTKPVPAPPKMWAWALALIMLGNTLQSNWWDGSSEIGSAKGWAEAIRSTVAGNTVINNADDYIMFSSLLSVDYSTLSFSDDSGSYVLNISY